jgi:hypothetical protein
MDSKSLNQIFMETVVLSIEDQMNAIEEKLNKHCLKKCTRKPNFIFTKLTYHSEEIGRFLELRIRVVDGQLLADLIGNQDNEFDLPAEEAVSKFLQRKILFFPED